MRLPRAGPVFAKRSIWPSGFGAHDNDRRGSLCIRSRQPRLATGQSERFRSRRILLAPAAILLAIVIVYPIGRLIFTSFHDLSLTSGLPARFVGIENFTLLLSDPIFWSTLRNTALITLVTVPGALLVGLAFALMANLPFRLKWPSGSRSSCRGQCRSPSAA